MDINEIFKSTNTNIPDMLSELIVTQCEIKGMMLAIIAEMSNNDPLKEDNILDVAKKASDQELLRVISNFSSNDSD